MSDILSVALPKGRLGERAYSIFERAGFGCAEIHENSRKLIFDDEIRGIRYFWAKPSDVASYVEYGAADVGVAGLDVLLEQKPEVFELLDLHLGQCAMAVAGRARALDSRGETLKVATKFPNVALRHFSEQGREIEVIKLHGSIELAPLVGLSDVIVDIVETGKTLRENGLEVLETIFDISSRLIVNKAAFRFKNERVLELCRKLEMELAREEKIDD
ncbi:MAG: ATP phosphoribosyltransferase [Oscillospiraceae bacterium]|jgi:ATP phosphoribosyltransferase|nr:ATP phosphoribosyltransferase [Oscillospiraceae bacterium]